MTRIKPDFFSSRSSNRQFLIYKTDSEQQYEKTKGRPSDDVNRLTKIFPDILIGKNFVDHTMEGLNSSAEFGAMVVRIDELNQNGETPGNDREADFIIEVAKTINTICKSENGMWGKLGKNMFGCFFPGKNEILTLELAGTIQNSLAELRKETVSIGVAYHPITDFLRDQVLDNALKALDHAAFFGPGSTVSFDAVSLNISGDKMYQNGDIDGAIKEFKAALLLDSSNVNVHNSLGVCYGVSDEYERALEAFEEAIRIDPDETMALYNAGLVNMLVGNQDKALEYFLDADCKEADVFEVALQIGRLYLEMKDSEKGKAFIEKAIKIKPESGFGYRYLGECYTALKKTDEAISAYKVAIRKNPNDADSLSALGHLFDLKGENPEITTILCQQSVDISPDNGLFRYRLGGLFLKRNMLVEALEQFQKADELGHEAKEPIQKVKGLLQEGKCSKRKRVAVE
jgi:tetratricopeptide (TPR) repeat protein